MKYKIQDYFSCEMDNKSILIIDNKFSKSMTFDTGKLLSKLVCIIHFRTF